MNQPNFQYAPPNRKNLYKSMIDNDKIINLKGKESKGYLTVAHELGHDSNSKRNILSKSINKLSKKYYKTNNKNNIKKRIMGRFILVKEERNADKNARKLLKKSGASKEIIKDYNRIRRNAINNYKHSRNAEILKGLAKKVSVRGKNTLNDIDKI